MFIKTENPSKYLTHFLIPVFGGIIIASGVTLIISSLRPVYIAVVIAGIIIFLPTFIVKEVKRYWLTLFIVSFIFDNISKRLTKSWIDPWELFQEYGMPTSGNLSVHLHVSDIILLVLVSAWILKIVTHKEKFYFPKICYLPLAYLTWETFCSLTKSVSLHLSFFDLVHQTVYFITYLYIVNNVNTKKLIKAVIFACLVAFFLEAVIVIAMFNLQSFSFLFSDVYQENKEGAGSIDLHVTNLDNDETDKTIRSRGTFAHPAHVALYFVFFLPLTFILIITSPTLKRRYLYIFLFLLGVIALILTFSRAGFLGFAVGIFFCFLIAARRNFISKRKRTIAIVLFVAFCFIISPKIYNFLTVRPETFTYRFELMQTGFKMFLKNPILGVGANNSTASNAKFGLNKQQENWITIAIHNQYQIIAIDTGIIGLILYLSFFILLAFKALQCSRSTDITISTFSIAILCTFLSIAFHANADPYAGNALLSMLWIYAGLIVAFEKMESKGNVKLSLR